jgi:cytochrome c
MQTVYLVDKCRRDVIFQCVSLILIHVKDSASCSFYIRYNHRNKCGFYCSMSSLETNKIFAAVLCAGITVMLGGFFAHQVVHPNTLEKDAVTIEGASDDHGGGVAAGPEMPEPIMQLIAAADIEKGAKISKACAACHGFEKGAPTKQGPGLWGVISHAKGAHEGFDYSPGLKAKGGVWDYDALNHFLWKPKKFVDGTKMNFIGLKKAEDRAALIAWLRQQADAPVALPTDTEIAAEAAALAPPAVAEAAPAEEAATTPATDKGAAAATETPAATEAAPADAPKEEPKAH